jgi:hypothetical protein
MRLESLLDISLGILALVDADSAKRWCAETVLLCENGGRCEMEELGQEREQILLLMLRSRMVAKSDYAPTAGLLHVVQSYRDRAEVTLQVRSLSWISPLLHRMGYANVECPAYLCMIEKWSLQDQTTLERIRVEGTG